MAYRDEDTASIIESSEEESCWVMSAHDSCSNVLSIAQ